MLRQLQISYNVNWIIRDYRERRVWRQCSRQQIYSIYHLRWYLKHIKEFPRSAKTLNDLQCYETSTASYHVAQRSFIINTYYEVNISLWEIWSLILRKEFLGRFMSTECSREYLDLLRIWNITSKIKLKINLHNLYSSLNICNDIKYKGMRLPGHVERIRNACKVFVENATREQY